MAFAWGISPRSHDILHRKPAEDAARISYPVDPRPATFAEPNHTYGPALLRNTATVSMPEGGFKQISHCRLMI